MVKYLDQLNETRVFDYKKKKKPSKKEEENKRNKSEAVGLEPTIKCIKNKRLSHLAILQNIITVNN